MKFFIWLLLIPVISFCSSVVDFDKLVKVGSLYYDKRIGKPLDGVVVKYYDDGKKWHETSYRNGIKHGTYRAYWKNGNLQYEGEYEYGKKEGLYRQWWDNGQLKVEIVYQNDKLLERN